MISSSFVKQVNNKLVPVHQVIINTTHIALVRALISSVTTVATVMSKRQKDVCTVTHQ